MSVVVYPRADGGLGLRSNSNADYDSKVGASRGDGFVNVNGEYNASSVDKVVFVAQRAYRVVGLVGRVTVAGTDGGAVTATLRKVASGTAISSGTALHSGTFNLKGTADTNQSLTLSTTSSDLDIAAGTALAIDFTGTLTSATGVFSFALVPK
jgi:hypothetical protein